MKPNLRADWPAPSCSPMGTSKAANSTNEVRALHQLIKHAKKCVVTYIPRNSVPPTE